MSCRDDRQILLEFLFCNLVEVIAVIMDMVSGMNEVWIGQDRNACIAVELFSIAR